MGIIQTKHRKKGPVQSAAEGVHQAVHPLYPNLTSEFPTYSHANIVDFRNTPTEACFGNPIPNFHNMQGPDSRWPAGVNSLYPKIANQFPTYAQPNTVDFCNIPINEGYFGNMMPNFLNVPSNYNPAPSAPPAPAEGDLLRAEIIAMVQSVIKQEVEMQTKQPPEPSCNAKNRRRKKKNKQNNSDDIHPEKKPCPNVGDGCKLYLKPAQMELHVKECLFMDYACPLNGVFGSCAWKRKVKDIRDHFEAKHPTNIGQVTKLMFLGISRIIHLVDMGLHKFLVQIKVDECKRHISVAVQYYGPQISASKWTYEFEFHGPMMPNMKLENTCIAACVPIEKFDKRQCGELTMTPCVMNAFKNGALKFKYRIMSVKSNKI